MHPAHGSDRPGTIWPPGQVRSVTSLHLDLVDEALPGLVEGLYLHGSIGFGEWYDGRSDVDFVAVTAERPDAATVAVLREVHARVGETFPRPSYDGLYVTWADLARPPADCPDVACSLPSALGGEWRIGRFDLNPVTWHELARHGVHVRGPALGDVQVWTDTETLRTYSHANLTDYWAGQVALLRQHPQDAARPDIVSWFVLGVPRLHHAIATGRLTSKDGAGHHAVATFGERWRPLVAEAMTYRALGEPSGMYDAQETRLAEETATFAELALERALALRPPG
jgi:hypothetical protein